MFSPTLALTLQNAELVLQAGVQAIDAGETEIDLAQLTTVDSAAVATLLAWQRVSLAHGRTLRFLNLPDNLQTLSRLYGVDALLDPASAVNATITTVADLPHH